MGKTHSRCSISDKHLACLGFAALASALGYTRPAAANAPITVDGVECARIFELGIDKELNPRAMMIRIECGLEEGPSGWNGREGRQNQLEPIANGPGGPTNVNTITDETNPIIQSESMVWSDGNQTIVVLYNDFQSPAFSGISVSTNGGVIFTRLRPSPFSTGHGSNFGDPVVVFNAALGSWFAGYLAGGCSGGVGLWSSFDGLEWSTGVCATPGGGDRESMWVDNNPDSPYYGRMYISWNASSRLMATYSDDGTTWSAPLQLTTNFIRNIQVTGSPTDGTVFIAAMDEGGGGFNLRTNIMYRSIDGGDSWTRLAMGPPFAPPGDATCGYFAKMDPIWRYMGWGQPGVGLDGVVHYAFGGKGINEGDTGDIYYTASFDNGDTWSDPIVLNTDAASGGTGSQWMPSLSVSPDGQVQVGWYDRRNSTDGLNYEYWGIRSPDNGLTWLPDAPVSDVLIPQSQEGGCYAGDYNYHTALGNEHYLTWTDGRNRLGGMFQQDVYFAKLP